MQRRSFLKGAGAITIAVIGGGVWRAYDQGVFSVGEGPAYEPWKNWRKRFERRNAGTGARRDFSRESAQYPAMAFQSDEFFD